MDIQQTADEIEFSLTFLSDEYDLSAIGRLLVRENDDYPRMRALIVGVARRLVLKQREEQERAIAGLHVHVGNIGEGNPDAQKLYQYVKGFIAERKIGSGVPVQQIDTLCLEAPDFLAECGEIVGFHREEEGGL